MKKSNKNEEVKRKLLKEYFNSGKQKKAITRAAKESAQDQNILLIEYRRLVKS